MLTWIMKTDMSGHWRLCNESMSRIMWCCEVGKNWMSVLMRVLYVTYPLCTHPWQLKSHSCKEKYHCVWHMRACVRMSRFWRVIVISCRTVLVGSWIKVACCLPTIVAHASIVVFLFYRKFSWWRNSNCWWLQLLLWISKEQKWLFR